MWFWNLGDMAKYSKEKTADKSPDESQRAHRIWRDGIAVTPRKTAIYLFAVMAVFSVLNIVTLILEFGFGYDWAKGFVPLFRLNVEANPPTIFSAFLLFSVAYLFAAIAKEKRSTNAAFAKRWTILAGIALFMVFDEAFMIHELLNEYRGWTNGLFNPTGYLVGPWVVIYGTIVLAFAALFFPLFLNLPMRYRLLFGGAGVMFVSGAIGLEMIAAQEWTLHRESLSFVVLNSFEEMMEMSAIIIVIYGALEYMQDEYGWHKVKYWPAA